jgi:hypothetical protein
VGSDKFFFWKIKIKENAIGGQREILLRKNLNKKECKRWAAVNSFFFEN